MSNFYASGWNKFSSVFTGERMLKESTYKLLEYFLYRIVSKTITHEEINVIAIHQEDPDLEYAFYLLRLVYNDELELSKVNSYLEESRAQIEDLRGMVESVFGPPSARNTVTRNGRTVTIEINEKANTK